MRIVQWVAGIAIVGGGGLLAAYGIFYASRDFFGSDDIALPIKVALPAVVAGAIALLVVVVIQRLQANEDRKLKEIEH